MPPRAVFFISDRTGITVETLGHSLLSQFESFQYTEYFLPFTDTEEKLERVIASIIDVTQQTGERPLVFATLVQRELQNRLALCDAMVVDFFRTFLGGIEQELSLSSEQRLGHTHGLRDEDRYDARMDTVNFALLTDDGNGTRQYAQADILLVGVSRSGKTPTCLYMALQFGIRAANFPITEEDLDECRLPAALLDFKARIFGLMIDAQRLHRIRDERMPDSRYASVSQCQYELRQLKKIFQREQIPFLDSTSMSVEEIATSILHTMGIRRQV